MSDDSYVLIRKRLNRFDRKLANVPSAMEMLKMLYTPEDANFCAGFPDGALTVRELAHFFGYREPEMEARLEELVQKNTLFTTIDAEGAKRYELMPWVPGIFELSVVTHKGTPWLDRFQALYQEYERELDARLSTVGSDRETVISVMPEPDVRTVPVHESLPSENTSTVYEYENILELINRETIFAAMRCTCRILSEQRGSPCTCAIPEYSCLQFGKAARHGITYGYAKEITREECIEIIEAAARAGAIHNANNFTEALQFICNCCPDCCGFVKTIQRLGNVKMITPSNFIPVVIGELCTGCGICEECCPVQAVAVNNGSALVCAEECIGCGICVAACPEDALSLKRRSEYKPLLGSRNIGMGY